MADNIVFTNNASAVLAATIDADDTTVQVATGFGALFPAPTGDEYFLATLEDNAGNTEIIKCTARAGDNLTVERAQDGSTAQAFTLTTTRVELRLVKSVMEEFLQKNGGTMTGDVDFSGNTITDAVLSGASTQILAGEIVGVPLRGAAGTSANEIAVPSGGGRATVGGAEILASGDDIVAELESGGSITLDPTNKVIITGDTNGVLELQDNGVTGISRFTQTNTELTLNLLGGNTKFAIEDVPLHPVAGVNLEDSDLSRSQLVDFAIKKQTVSGIASTTIDYESGSYVTLNLSADVGSLTLSNPPASHVGTLRLKIVQDSTARTITWPASVQWPGGVAPTLSTGSGDIDFVDLWTDDGGTTWYGAYNTDWS